MSVVDVVCCGVSGRWDGLITRLEESSLMCVCVYARARHCMESGATIILYTYNDWVEVKLRKKERKNE